MPRLHETPIETLRRGRRKLMPQPAHDVDRVEDFLVPGPGGDIPVRVYRNDGRDLPVVIFHHGGGFVFGGLDGYYDPLCRRLATQVECAVVAVDYRLAPEHKFPAAAEDSYAVHSWLASRGADIGIDATRMALVGISAGGNLAAATALRARDENGPKICGVVLFYPVLDYHTPGRESYRTFSDGYYLTRADMVWFWRQYLADESDAANPYAAPLRAETLDGIAPTLIFAAECDPLRDEAEAFHRRLADAGVAATLSRCRGMIHGFLAFPVPRTNEIISEAVQWLRKSFAGGTGCPQPAEPGGSRHRRPWSPVPTRHEAE